MRPAFILKYSCCASSWLLGKPLSLPWHLSGEEMTSRVIHMVSHTSTWRILCFLSGLCHHWLFTPLWDLSEVDFLSQKSCDVGLMSASRRIAIVLWSKHHRERRYTGTCVWKGSGKRVTDKQMFTDSQMCHDLSLDVSRDHKQTETHRHRQTHELTRDADSRLSIIPHYV